MSWHDVAEEKYWLQPRAFFVFVLEEHVQVYSKICARLLFLSITTFFSRWIAFRGFWFLRPVLGRKKLPNRSYLQAASSCGSDHDRQKGGGQVMCYLMEILTQYTAGYLNLHTWRWLSRN